MSNTNLSILKTDYTQPELDVINVEVSDSFLNTPSGGYDIGVDEWSPGDIFGGDAE